MQESRAQVSALGLVATSDASGVYQTEDDMAYTGTDRARNCCCAGNLPRFKKCLKAFCGGKKKGSAAGCRPV
ncbi:MAG: hypothetical protein WDW36_009855 [Sanguina aurantia]